MNDLGSSQKCKVNLTLGNQYNEPYFIEQKGNIIRLSQSVQKK